MQLLILKNRMKKLFLTSSFKDVANLLVPFSQESLIGKRITFIPTASIPESIKFYVNSGRKALEKMGLQVDELEITKASTSEIRDKLQANDFIYVSGGNTFFLLQELKRSGADKIIIEEINSGKMYIGESAGSIILSPSIEFVKDMDDFEKAPNLRTYSALNIVDFYPLPHLNNFPFKKKVERIISKYQSQLDLYAISNSQVILVNGNDIKTEST